MRSPFLLALATLFLVAGCSSNSFVGRRYDNFTAYYNTFYNAKNAYDQGVENLEQQDQPIDRNRYLPLFSAFTARSAGGQAFNNAIGKSADVLREHPNSKWVDDALLLIGKSYFQLQNYVGAEQKFREVMTLDSRLEGEARFWLARTLIAAGQYDAAFDHLQESLNSEDIQRRWISRLRLAQGELEVQRQDWEAAAQQLAQGLTDVPDNDLGARAQFLLGQVYETLGLYDEAVAAYEEVQRYKPLYELSYAAQVSAVRVQGLHGDAEEALRRLRRMERDDKNYDYRAELAYLRGRLYQAQGHAAAALDEYWELLYDSDANISQVAGKTYYALGELYRDLYVDFEFAAAYFDTAATRLRSGNNTQQQSGSAPVVYAPAAITDAAEQQRIFGSFRDVWGEISRMDSLLELGQLDQEAFDAFVLDLRQKRAEELAAQQRAQERQRAEQSFGNFEGQAQRNPVSTSAQGNSEAGFLFHRDPVRVQQGIAEFELRWGNRPLVPNWRRESAVLGAQAAANPANAGASQAVVTTESTDGVLALPEVDISGVPRTLEAQAAMRADRSVAWYELANVLFLSMNRPDSAATWYRFVIDESGDEPVAQRAYYALAEVQQALHDSVTARELYRTIVEQYPTSEFASRAREQIGMTVAEETKTDSLALAEAAYNLAYATWADNRYAHALDDMVKLAALYPGTEVAPKALFAAGRIYQEWSSQDSLDLFAPLPLGISDSLLISSGLLEPTPAPDTTQAVDTTAVAATLPEVSADSLAAAAAPADSLALAEALVPADSTTIPADSLRQEMATDSLYQEVATGSLPADSVRASGANPEAAIAEPAVPDSVRLESLYQNIIKYYPKSPQAEQAQRVLAALEERRPKPEVAPDSTDTFPPDAAPTDVDPDSTLAAPTDSLAIANEGLATDSTAQDLAAADLPGAEEEQRQQPGEEERLNARRRAMLEEREILAGERSGLEDERRAPGDSTLVQYVPLPPASEPSAALPTELPLAVQQEQAGKWTIVAMANERRPMAEAMLIRLRSLYNSEELPVYLLPAIDEGRQIYQVVVGFYPSQEAAATARLELRDLPREGTTYRQIIAPRE